MFFCARMASTAIVVCSALNYLIEKIAYRPLRNAPRLAPLITAMGMSLLLQTLAMIIWQPSTKPYPILLPNDPIFIGGAVINLTQILILSTTAVTLLALMYLVNRTKLGRAMRATAENPRVAALMGVRPDHVISATFIIGAALAALAGVMYAANYGTVQHTMGFMPGLKAFTAAVLGGIGNLAGAMVGGLFAAYLIPRFGWQSLFLLGGWAPILAGLAVALALPESLEFLVRRNKEKDGAQVREIISRIAPALANDPDVRFVPTEKKLPGVPLKRLFTEGRALTTLLLWVVCTGALYLLWILNTWSPTLLRKTGATVQIYINNMPIEERTL